MLNIIIKQRLKEGLTDKKKIYLKMLKLRTMRAMIGMMAVVRVGWQM
jgi:hypothetical protein